MYDWKKGDGSVTTDDPEVVADLEVAVGLVLGTLGTGEGSRDTVGEVDGILF